MGAGCGTKSERRQSHAGVLSRLPSFEVTLFDPDRELVRDAAKIFRLSSIEKIEPGLLGAFDCAVICAPSAAHAEYLSTFLAAGLPLIVCEKPICVSEKEAQKLRALRERCECRVLVNYTRRFLPSYARLRKTFARLSVDGPLQAISVRYQRGFLNNASHALDLVQFLTGWDIGSAKVRAVQRVNDEFADDPTLTCHGQWNGASLSIVGLPNVRFSLFEIDFFFARDALRLRDRGDTVELAGAAASKGYYAPLETKTATRGHLRSPLEHLYHRVVRMSQEPRLADNFDESLDLASWSFEALKRK